MSLTSTNGNKDVIPAYSSSVAKIAGRTAIPDDAQTNPHHVLKGGSVKGFKNPYPSWTGAPTPLSMLKSVLWSVDRRATIFRFKANSNQAHDHRRDQDA